MGDRRGLFGWEMNHTNLWVHLGHLLCIALQYIMRILVNDCLGFGCRRQQKRHEATPPPAGVRRRMKRKRQKLVGRDKGSLTEQKTEGNRNNNDTDKEKTRQKTDLLSRTAPAPHAPELREWVPAPPTGTQRDGTWYGIPGSVWSGGVSPHPLAVPLPGVRWKLTLSWPNPGQQNYQNADYDKYFLQECPFYLSFFMSPKKSVGFTSNLLWS